MFYIVLQLAFLVVFLQFFCHRFQVGDADFFADNIEPASFIFAFTGVHRVLRWALLLLLPMSLLFPCKEF